MQIFSIRRFALKSLLALSILAPAGICSSITLLAPPIPPTTPDTYVNSEGVAINNSGVAAVTLYTATQSSSSIYTGGIFTRTTGTVLKQSATGINSSGTESGTFFTGLQKSSAFYVTSANVNTNLKDLSMGSTYHGSETMNINDNGFVVGGSYTGNSTAPEHAVAWIGGTAMSPTAPTSSTAPTDLGTFTDLGSYSIAYDINSPGISANYEIVGTAGASDSTDTDGYAFMYTKAGGMKHVTGLETTVSDAFGVNNSGQIVGDEEVAGGNFHAFLFTAGIVTDIGTLGATNSQANAINAAGQAVGYAYDLDDDGNFTSQTAFLYSGGTLIDLNTFLPANSGWVLQDAEDINDANQIVGYGLYNGVQQGFLLNITQTQTTPEPGSLILLTAGIAAIGIGRKRLFDRN